MKKIICFFLIVMIVAVTAGCGSEKADAPEDNAEPQTESSAAVDTAEEEAEPDAAEADPDVDVDLTVLNSTMVYGQVYDMMTKPDEYYGKKVKMNGLFAVYTDEVTGNNYFACIIQDATACCSQGIEFELEGDYTYPDDYPEQGKEITVTGVFDTYEEAGNSYCTLRNAKIL